MNATRETGDFADWLSPMLVKELRQGMSSRMFVMAFYLTQALMILSTMFNLMNASADSQAINLQLNGLFWFLIALPVVFLIPRQGFGALHGEMKERTLELVLLTRLSAWRVVAGKWAAIMMQTLLLVCAILPYVLLRYFLGGVNVVLDLQILYFMLILSGVLTAAMLVMSAYESKMLRGFFVLGMAGGGFFLMMSGLMYVAFLSSMGRPLGTTIPWQIHVAIVAYVPAILLLMLEMAASRIAPAAENHAIRKRLLGLYFLLPAVAAGVSGIYFMPALAVTALLVAIVMIDSLSERTTIVRSLHTTFTKRGIPGRLMKPFFLPGWSSAAWCVAFTAAILWGMAYWQLEQSRGLTVHLRTTLAIVSGLGLILVPAVLIRLFFPDTRKFFGLYIGFQIVFIVITIITGMVQGITGEPVTEALRFVPNCVFFLNMSNAVDSDDIRHYLVLSSVALGISLIALLIRATAENRHLHAILNHVPSNDARL